MSNFFNTELSPQQFLDNYWQKKPLLIRQAFPQFISPISAEELAGLACEQDIESRIIEEFGTEGNWQLRHGPFTQKDFAALPETHWTLLVQDVDKHVPELAHILSLFDFIPDWRRDDLMISFAAEGGSVGPHTDGYDVFLLQAMGTRRWQISDTAITEAELLPDMDLKILAQFEPAQSWDLQPGDMLYLPPHYAHHGVAVNDCMTFSVGFRAPTAAELLDSLVNKMLEQGLGQAHYGDPDLVVSDEDTEIDEAALCRVNQLLHDSIDQAKPIMAKVLGQLVTETKSSLVESAAEYFSDEQCDEATLDCHFTEDDCLIRNPYYRFAWRREADHGYLFFAGESYTVSAESTPLLPILCQSAPLDISHWQQIKDNPELVALLCQLVEEGGWYWNSRQI